MFDFSDLGILSVFIFMVVAGSTMLVLVLSWVGSKERSIKKSLILGSISAICFIVAGYHYSLIDIGKISLNMRDYGFYSGAAIFAVSAIVMTGVAISFLRKPERNIKKAFIYGIISIYFWCTLFVLVPLWK